MGIEKIAQLANVSIATVSRVLNKPELVSVNTRNKVLKIAEEIDYNRYSSNQIEAKNKNEIGVVIPNILNTFFARILEGIIHQAKILDLPVTLYLTNDKEEEELSAINKLIEKQIRGVILIRTNNSEANKTIQKMNKHKIPFVLIDRDVLSSDYSGVFLSNANAVYDAITLLIKDSYEKIYIITGPSNNLNANQRLEGYKEALNNNNIELSEDMIHQAEFSIESGFNVTSKILEQKELPEVIFSCANNITVGAIRAIAQKGLKLGKDIKLFSFIKLDASYINNFDISYIEHPAHYMGEKSVTILKNKFVGTKGVIREILSYKIHY